jgi:hypothetical protein
VTPLIVWMLRLFALAVIVAWVLKPLWVKPTRRNPWATPGYRGNLRRRLIGQNVERAP